MSYVWDAAYGFGRLHRLLDLFITTPSLLVDFPTMYQRLNVRTLIFLLIAILFLLITSKEEMQRCTLHLDNRVETSKCNNRNTLGVIPTVSPPSIVDIPKIIYSTKNSPDPLPPEFLR